MPSITLAVLSATTCQSATRSTDSETHQQGPARHPNFSPALLFGPRGYTSQFTHKPVAPSLAPNRNDAKHAPRLARQHAHLRLSWPPSSAPILFRTPWHHAALFSSPMTQSARNGTTNYWRIGFYLGPALRHYRSYHCFITDTNATRICDSVMFYPAPLVLPGASRFDQLLQLTERLVIAAESKSPEPNTLPLYTECLQKLKDFFLADVTNAPRLASSHVTVPVTAPTKHCPSTDIGIDIVGYTFTYRALGRCKFLAPSTYTDENNTVWNTLEFTSSTYPNET
jgi:hypothetical protein